MSSYGFKPPAPVFLDGIHCQHGYPPGEHCPACGEIPTMGPDYDEPCEFCGDEPCPHGCAEEASGTTDDASRLRDSDSDSRAVGLHPEEPGA